MTLPVSSGSWTIDTNATKVSFTIKKMMFMTIPGTFKVASGTATIGDDLASSTISATIDASSFDTSNAKRDEHIKSDDFLDVANAPTISFESTAIRAVGSGFEIDGTIQAGASAPITLTVTDVSAAADAVTFTATGQIERAALGLGKLPNLVIGKVADITVTGRAIRG